MRDVRLLHGIDLGAVVGHAFRLRACPAKTACTGFHMILIVGLPLPAASYGSSCVYVARVGRFPVINEFADPGYPTARRFVAASQHTVRGVIAVFFGQSDSFVHQIFVNRLPVAQSWTVIRPAGTFGLQIKTNEIGSDEGCFRRTERVETHMVQSVVAADAEYPFPGSYVHRCITSKREIAVFHCTAEHCLASVDVEPFAFYLEITHTELYLFLFRLLTAIQHGCQFVECRIELIPRQEVFSHR